MARISGRSSRHWTTVKVDGVPDRRVPHCNGCDVMMEEVNLPTLQHWEPEFKYTRKYPFAEPAFFCEPCRKGHSLHHKNYVLVPMGDTQSLREALCAMLGSMPED